MNYEDVKRIRENPSLKHVDNEELHRMIDQAIEKQIPKKPKDGYYIPYFRNRTLAECPVCGNIVSWIETKGYEDFFKTYAYCPVCGQSIDWSEEE